MKSRRAPRFQAFGLLALAVSCVGESKKLQDDDIGRLKVYVLNAPPERIAHKQEINYDNKVTLLGYDIEPDGLVEPSSRVKITLYWRSDQKLEPDWKLFTHILDGSGDRILNIDNVGPLRQWKDTRQALAPSAWAPGKVYVDEQSFTLPNKIKSQEIQLTTGIWKDNGRLAIVSGPHDDENRGIVATLKVGRATLQPPKSLAPRLSVFKLNAKTKINIDGKLDEAAWESAANTGAFVDVATGLPNETFPVNARALALWDDTGAYFGFTVSDPNVVGGFEKKSQDPHLWTRDTIEIMIDPDGDGDNLDYYEIQINPQNLIFDSQFDQYNAPKQEPNGPFGHEGWASGIKSAVTIQGTLDQSSDRDQGYVVEAFLPWKSLSKAKTVPPRPGDTWRINLYAMQNNGGVAWSPILKQGNFHKASRFGYVVWAGATGKL